jgi:hypothetical protein
LPKDLTSLSREELLVLVAQLERQVAQLSASLEALQAENAQLQQATSAKLPPFPKVPGRISPSVQVVSPGKAPSLFARHHAPKTSPDPQ